MGVKVFNFSIFVILCRYFLFSISFRFFGCKDHFVDIFEVVSMNFSVFLKVDEQNRNILGVTKISNIFLDA